MARHTEDAEDFRVQKLRFEDELSPAERKRSLSETRRRGFHAAVLAAKIAEKGMEPKFVLTDIYPSRSLDEAYGWRVRTELIAQPKPTVGLPDGLKFPGDLVDTLWLSGDIYKME